MRRPRVQAGRQRLSGAEFGGRHHVFHRRFGMRATLGTILMAVCALPAASAAQAQNAVSNAFRSIEQRQAKNITDAAEEMPADKYSYKPTPAQMSFGDVVAHLIADGNDYLCSAASGMKRSEERRVGKECRSRWSPYH